jgi:hypothetical protein
MGRRIHACDMKDDTCMSYEEEDTCISYEEEDTCMSTDSGALDRCAVPFGT